jgi:hypothetical protein
MKKFNIKYLFFKCRNFFAKRPKRYVSLEAMHEVPNESDYTNKVYNEVRDSQNQEIPEF